VTARRPPRKDQPTYTEEQKAQARKLYVSDGSRAASRVIGCSEPAVRRWVREWEAKTGEKLSPPTANITAGVQAQNARIAAKRAKIKERLLDEALYCMDAIHNKHIDFKGVNVQEVAYPVAPAAAVQNYATSVGILIDKFRLENGESTSRDEVITVDKLDAEIARLAAEVGRRELADTGTTQPTGGAEGPA
jgi:transposase-like protein